MIALKQNTLAAAIKEAAALLEELPNPQFEAEALLSFLLQKNRAYFRTWPEKELTAEQLTQFAQLLEERKEGKPLAYITGQREFWSLDLKVTPATLIPRPETELLVEEVLARVPEDAQWQIADLGTGTGAIALSLASERPLCHVSASDISPEALEVAEHNAEQHNIKNISLHHGSWLEALKNKQFNIIASNPPYVDADDPHLLRDGLPFEPQRALTPGKDGLAAIHIICEQAKKHLVAPGWLLLEHGYDQANAIQILLKEQGYREITTYKDLSGNDRMTAARFHADT